jgi:hypothetical protein
MRSAHPRGPSVGRTPPRPARASFRWSACHEQHRSAEGRGRARTPTRHVRLAHRPVVTKPDSGPRAAVS